MGGATGSIRAHADSASHEDAAVMTGGTDYLRASEIARLTGMSLRTVRRWIADEIIPSTKLGGARLVARADLERLLYPPPHATDEADDDAE
jgi:excisionase family DNA binding protein